MVKTVCFVGLYCLFLLFSQELKANDTKTFEGKYSLSETLSGIAVFDYLLVNGDTIFDGKFRFETTKLLSAEESDFTYQKIEIEGTYKNNLKNGEWIFRVQKLKPRDQPLIDAYEISYLADGENYLVNAFFEKGKAIKTWKVIHQLVENSKLSDTLYFAQSDFSEGIMSNQFQMNSTSHRIRGELGEKGLMNGKWQISYINEKITEWRTYTNGAYVSHQLSNEKTRIDLSHLALDTSAEKGENQKWEILEVNDLYDEIYCKSLDLKGSESSYSSDSIAQFCDRGTRLLIEANRAFSAYEGFSFWKITEGSEAIEPMKVFVLKNLLSEKEEREMRRSLELLKNSENILESYFHNPQINVSKLSSEDFAFYHRLMEIYREKVEQLSHILQWTSMEALAYLNREKLVEVIGINFYYPDSVEYKFKDESYQKEYTFPQKIDKDKASFEDYHNHLKVIHTDLIEIEGQIKSIFNEYRKQNILSKDESTLVEKRDSVEMLYFGNHPKKDFNSYHNSVAKTVLQLTEKEFKLYAEFSLEEKLNQIDSIINCYNDFIKAYNLLSEIPKKVNSLDKYYTREVWNPFTYTDMEERVKPDLFNAFETELLPYYTDLLSKSSSCERLIKVAESFEDIYKVISNYRTKETESIEKQLKKAKSREEVLEILSLIEQFNY